MHHNFPKNLKDEFHKFRIMVFAIFCFCMAATFSFLAVSHPLHTSAAPVQGFNPGNIISDAVMADYNSMTVEEIQNFLTSKNSCNNKDYELYLYQTSTYKTVTWHWSGTADNGHFVCLSEERFGEGTEIGTGQTAAEIIYEAAQASRINPKVLIVLLEKEQGLISDTFPHSGQYRAATGYGCPDTAACDSKYYGFKNQVFRAAELFRYTLDNGYYLYPENKPGVFVAYNPSSSCGGTNVLIENRATAALYRYTPYQPNAAALAAGYGQGDACSAYGNRNFYLLFTDWFGSTQAEPSAPDANDPKEDPDEKDPSNGNGDQSAGEKPASQPIPDGTYTIHSAANTGKALDVSGASDQDGSNVQLWFSNGTSAQSWQITYNSATDDYTIRNTMSGRALDLDAAIVDVRTNIQLYKYNGTCAQRWKFIPTTNNSYAIASACDNGYVIDIDDGKIQDGTNIQLWFKNNTSAQDWQFRAVDTPSILPDGTYTIHSAANTGKALDVSGASDQDGSNVQLWFSNGTSAQSWQITYNSATDDYTIRNTMSGRALDLDAAIVDVRTNIQLYKYNGTCAQRWKFIPTTNNSYAIASACDNGYVIDIDDGKIQDGTNIQLWFKNNTSAQDWQFREK